MDENEYETVNSEDDDHFKWKYFFRQLMIASVVWSQYFIYGLEFGAPTVFIPQIRKEDNDAINESMQSWIVSLMGFSSVPWVIILPISIDYLGRKYPYIFSCAALLASSVVLYCSNSVTEIIVAELLMGIAGAACTTVAIMTIVECTSPKYRGIFLTFKSASFCWGIWISNAIGTYFHWKNIPLLMFILSIYPIVVVLFWPESPYFLASKSKLDKCAESHRWLKGYSKESNEELMKLLSTRKLVSNELGFFKTVAKKRFYKAFLLSLCLLLSYTLSGKQVCTVYSIDIIKKMTSNDTMAYTGMLILDGVTVFSMYIGSMLSKILKRRVLFIFSLSVGTISLFLLSARVFLVQLSVLQENNYITIVLLSVYSIGIAFGPLILSTSLLGELIPLQYRCFAICTISIIDKSNLGIVLKLSPMLIRKFGLHVVFFMFGVASTINILIVYFYMPETKDKTLFEISDEIEGKKKNFAADEHDNLAE